MKSVFIISVFGFLVLCLTGYSTPETAGGGGDEGCGFSTVYNFGDSNSDTGGLSAAFSAVPPPNGESYFGKPAGRYSDGRLIIDFIAENLKLPYLSPYLDSLGTNFRHGANFATAGSTIKSPGYSPFDLGIQVSQFIQFKARTATLYRNYSKSPPLKSRLPRPEDFSTALYTIDIGQNDLNYGLEHSTEEKVRASIPDIINDFSNAVQLLYKEGARFFWVHNTCPIGCLPLNVLVNKPNNQNQDKNGCVKSQNDIAIDFNTQLKNKLEWLKTKLSYAVFTYVDVYSAKYALITNSLHEGFHNPLIYCCGSYLDGRYIRCGKPVVGVNGTAFDGIGCKDPDKYISWDGIHYTQAANMWLAKRIIDGSFSEPRVSIQNACQKHV